jgi:soluble P-type ATPase
MGGLTTTTQSFRFQFNSDTATNYSYTYLAGNGSTASSSRASNASGINAYHVSGQSDTNLKNNLILNLQNYSNTTTNKTCVIRGNTDLETAATVGLYRSTSVISSLTVLTTNGNLQAGSTFTLYGIKAGS